MVNGHRRTAAALLFLLAATLFLSAPLLQYVPAYLAHDEVLFSLNAHSIATTGHDVQGRFFPLFFQVNARFWATPIVIYTTALFLKVLPLSETVIRLPSVLVGVADVLLVYLVGARVLRNRWLALLAAALLALTPAHFIHSRLAVDHIYPLPFLLGSLLCLVVYLERPDLRVLFLGTSLLGLGFYSYLGCVAMMPLYFLLTCGTIVAVHGKPARPLLVAAAGFIWPILVIVPWLLQHPAQFSRQVQMYSIYDSTALNPLQGLRELLSYTSLTARAGVYYEFFNPSFLFLSGDAGLINSTRMAGVFLLPLAVFIPIGINHIVNARRTPAHLVLLVGFALAPVAALLVLEVKVNRALAMLPFGVLIATVGVDCLLRATHKLWRAVGIALLVAIPLQFGLFYHDYFTAYRLRSSFWFERNIRGALEDVIARDGEVRVPAVYISRTPRWIDWYWKWYLAKDGRMDLLTRTAYVDPRELEIGSLAPHSVVFGEVEEIEQSAVFRAGAVHVTAITEPDGKTSFIVFEK